MTPSPYPGPTLRSEPAYKRGAALAVPTYNGCPLPPRFSTDPDEQGRQERIFRQGWHDAKRERKGKA